MQTTENLLQAINVWWTSLSTMKPLDIATSVCLTFAAIAVAVAIRKLARFLICRAFAILPNETKADRDVRARKALRLTHILMDCVVGLSALIAIAAVWGIDVLSWFSQGQGKQLASVVTRLSMILLLAALALELVSLVTNRTVKRLREHSSDPRRTAQLQTLGPIIRRVGQTIIVLLTAMTLLGQLGVEIAPILSAAGVVGIAVGFGAQTLVKDFFTGLFLLVEDIVAIGDVVQIQAFSGEVEDMTLRTIRLRDADGTLHIFPYGESQIIHNMTKSLSFAAMDIPVKADTDLKEAMRIMKTTADTLRKEAGYASLILNDIEIAGIDLLSDVGIIIKARIRTVPNDRWRVLRAYNLRIKQAFDAAGIVITHK